MRTLADADATHELAARIGALLRPGHVLLLEGPLGAGKTTFVQGLAVGMGLADEVTSPTFTLVHEYRQGAVPLYHFDAYRLDDADEVADLGWFEYLEAGGVVAVEWAERLGPLGPADALCVRLEPAGVRRTVTLEATGPVHRALLASLEGTPC